jgi:hypothetical protein
VLGLRGDFKLGLLKNVRTVQTSGALGDRLNAFCLMR